MEVESILEQGKDGNSQGTLLLWFSYSWEHPLGKNDSQSLEQLGRFEEHCTIFRIVKIFNGSYMNEYVQCLNLCVCVVWNVYPFGATTTLQKVDGLNV
jgi:hypothetical protein